MKIENTFSRNLFRIAHLLLIVVVSLFLLRLDPAYAQTSIESNVEYIPIINSDSSLAQSRDIESFNVAPETVEETDLPIYVQIGPNMKEITLINQNDVPVDLYILAMDEEGFEIASWLLPAFSDPTGVRLKLADIFRGVPAVRIAYVKVIVDEPYIVREVQEATFDARVKLNSNFSADQQQVSSQGNISAQLFLSANPLPVLFIPQVPPGTWSGTNNCGQTSSLMVMSYHNGTTPTQQGIMNIDDWLYNRYGNPINNYNGSVTNTTKLEALVKEYGGFVDSYKAAGWNLDNLRSKINEGLPVIAAVTAGYLSNRGYDYSGGHFVVVIGYTDTHIICNDPGTTSGQRKYYSNTEFSQAFTASGSSVVVVIPKGNTCSDFGEPNGSFSSAYALSCGTTSTAKICSLSDVDWYKVTPSFSGTMTITLTSPSDKDYDLYVYNSTQTQVCSATSGAGLQDVCNFSVTGGQIYYIKVIGYGGAFSTTSNYSLGVTCPSATTLSNLTPYKPSTWSDKIVVSKTTGTNTDSSPLYATDTLYIDWAVINNGSVSITTTFYTRLYVDGVLKTSWYTSPPLYANYYTTVTDFSIGSLSTGTHTIKIATDATGVIGESNESDNSYTKTITIQGSSSPTLLVDGGTSSTKAQGGTFSLTGSNYTPNGTVSRYVNGSAISSIAASSSGTITWSWPTDCMTAIGTYTVYAKDNASGKTSNTVTEVLTASSSCTAPQYEGWIDSADCNTISGWAWNKNQPNTPISVDIYNGSTKLATVTANIFRQDLVNAGKGNGYHGFSYSTPISLKDGTAHSIYVKYGGTSTNLSGSPKSITCGGTPTLLINGGTSSTKSQGGTFVTTGVNYTPSGAVTRYLKQPNGTTITLTPTLYANSSGNISWSYTSICTTAIGTYYLWVKDNATGKTSNTVTQIVTASSRCNPTLLINGGTSSTKSQGGTFVTTGVNYTPSGAVTRYLKQPNGTTITLTPTLYANSSGNISWSYTSICTTAIGTYYLWVKDNATGKTSNTVTQIVTKSSSCP